MALQKTKQLDDGSEGNYWKILNIILDTLNHKVTIDIPLYKDKSCRDNGMPHMQYKEYRCWEEENNPLNQTIESLDLPENTTLLDAVLTVLYTKVKESKLDEDGNETEYFAADPAAIDI